MAQGVTENNETITLGAPVIFFGIFLRTHWYVLAQVWLKGLAQRSGSEVWLRLGLIENPVNSVRIRITSITYVRTRQHGQRGGHRVK